jgi:hypothetical protein
MENAMQTWMSPEETEIVIARNDAARLADLALCERLCAEWAAEAAMELAA